MRSSKPVLFMQTLVKLLPLLALTILGPLTLTGQQETFQVDFKVYGLRPGDYSNVMLQDSEGLKSITFKPKSRSESYTANLLFSDPVLRFKHLDGEKVPMAATRIEPNTRQILLIFTKTNQKNNRLPYTAIPVEDSTEGFGIGTLRVMNLTGVEIFGTFNGSRFILNNGESSEAGQTSNDGPTEIAVAAQGKSRIHLLYKNKLKLNPQSRSLLLLLPPERQGSLRIGGHLLTESFAEE